jgi:peptide/nickel transport system substrate-binding protein
MKLRTSSLRLATATLALAGLAACSQSEEAPPAEPTLGQAEVAPTEDTGGATTPADTLVFAHPEDASKLDPSDVTDSESLLATWHIFEGLTRYKPGTTEVEPSLATQWTTSEDGLEWTFTLRDGVTFHDGEPFDAEAVVWNFNRWFDPADPSHFADWEFAYWGDMFQGFKGADKDGDGEEDSFFVSAEAVDPATVKLTLRRPNAPLLQTLAMSNFAFSSPAAVEAAGASYGTPDGNPIAIGTGPYMVESWQNGDQITLVANADYWGDAPATPNLVLRKIPDNSARFLALRAGEIDGMNQMNPEDIASAESDENVQVIFEPANNVGYLGFNQAHAPWGNLNCRLAVAHSIDKQAIVDGLHAGDAEAATQMMPPKLWGFNAAIEDYAYDPEAAKTALDACLAEETMPASVSLFVPPIARFYFPKPAELGEAIQSGLAGLGITTEIQSPEWQTYLTQVRAGEADLFLLGWGGDNGDPDNFLCVFFCGGDGAWNSDADGTALPPNDELNTMLREAATLSDQAARQTMYEEANQLAHDEVLSVPLVHRTPPLGFGATISGYASSPIQTILTTVSKQ